MVRLSRGIGCGRLTRAHRDRYGAPPAGYGAPPGAAPPGYGAPPAAAPPGYGAPPPQQGGSMVVTCPPHLSAGMPMQVQAASGVLQVTIPAGVQKLHTDNNTCCLLVWGWCGAVLTFVSVEFVRRCRPGHAVQDRSAGRAARASTALPLAACACAAVVHTHRDGRARALAQPAFCVAGLERSLPSLLRARDTKCALNLPGTAPLRRGTAPLRRGMVPLLQGEQLSAPFCCAVPMTMCANVFRFASCARESVRERPVCRPLSMTASYGVLRSYGAAPPGYYGAPAHPGGVK